MDFLIIFSREFKHMTTVTYNLAPNGRFGVIDKIGRPAANGKLFTWRNQTRDFKNTYQDPAGLILNENPIKLNGAGEANIYWADDEFYTIRAEDEFGTEIYTQDNFPKSGGSGGGGDIIINETFENIVLNHQFLRWGNNNFNKAPSADTVYTRLGLNDQIADCWFFKRSNTNATVVVSRGQFNVGQSQVPGNPINYIEYQCTNVGAGAETFKCFYQSFPSAQLFSNTEISFSFWAMSTSSDPITVYLEQYFGSGGAPSPTVITNILTATLTSQWTQYTGQITVPSVAGKVFGTNGDDSLNLCIGLPLNAIAHSFCSAVQLNQGNELIALETTTVNDQLLRNTQTALSPYQTGDYILSLSSAPRPGWLLCNDSTIGSSFSGASYVGNNLLPLFLVLWEVSATYVTIFDSGGSPTSRGVSAIADFNADKRLSLTKTLGRVLGSSGAGSGLTARALGEYLGAETVTLAPTNLPPHFHGFERASGFVQKPSGSGTECPTFNIDAPTTGGAEYGLSSTPFGIMQPTLFLNCFIKL